MHLSVTSEGIETISVLRALSELGCDYGQGFFFAKPLPAEDVNFKALASYSTDDEFTSGKVERRKATEDRRKATNKNEDDQNDHPQVINIETKFKNG